MEFIIAIIILVVAFKYVILNVKVNSIVFGVLALVVFYLKPEFFSPKTFTVFLLVLNMVDCFRDIVVSDKYYELMSEKIDKQYAFKSVSSIALSALGWFCCEKNFTLGLAPRAVFLVLIYPVQYWLVANDVKTTLEQGHPIPYHYQLYRVSKKECYWYNKVINSLIQTESIISNANTVIDETNISRTKLKKNYPENLFQKMVFSVLQKEQKNELKKMNNTLKNENICKHMAYISTDTYSLFLKNLYEVLKSKKAVFSPSCIKKFKEFNDMNLDYPNGVYEDNKWSEYFIIRMLSDCVDAGKLIDYRCSDEPLDNHSYGMEIKSHNASDDPRLALDDD